VFPVVRYQEDPTWYQYHRLCHFKEGKPFDVTGVDCTGAQHMRNNGTEAKVYICLFTCGLSRIVHLEVACDLSVQTFLRAFR